MRAGEEFYSVLIAEGAQVVRRDFSTEAWEGPPEECLGWWKATVPDPKSTKMQWAPNEVMLHYFEDLAQQREKRETRYVLALLLLRRKVFRLQPDDVESDDSGDTQPDSSEEVLSVYCATNDASYQVRVVVPDEMKSAEIQNELAELLFARA